MKILNYGLIKMQYYCFQAQAVIRHRITVFLTESLNTTANVSPIKTTGKSHKNLPWSSGLASSSSSSSHNKGPGVLGRCQWLGGRGHPSTLEDPLPPPGGSRGKHPIAFPSVTPALGSLSSSLTLLLLASMLARPLHPFFSNDLHFLVHKIQRYS